MDNNYNQFDAYGRRKWKWIECNEEGYQMEWCYSGGEKSWEWLTYWKPGIVQEKINYSFWKMRWKFTWYHQNGQIAQEWNYENGELDWVWKFYFENGNICMIQIYEKGNLIDQKFLC